MAWTFGLLGAAGASLPAFIVRFVNSTRNYGGVGGAFVDASGYSYVTLSNNNGGGDGGQITQKVAPDNSVVWSNTFPNSYGGEVSLNVDSSGNVYTGGFHGSSPGDYYFLAVKTSPTGTLLWQKWFGGSVTYPDWYRVNQNGQGAVAGGAFTSGRFLSLDSSGTVVFSKSGNLGGVASNYEGGYICGVGTNRILFGHFSNFNVFTTTGTFVFGKSVSSFAGTGPVKVMADDDDNVICWVTTGSNNIAYVTKFGPTGTKLWDRQISAPSGLLFMSTHGDIDASGNIYLPFTYRPSDSSTDKLIWVAFDASGNTKYQRSLDAPGVADDTTLLNVNRSTKRGFISGYSDPKNGIFVSFDLATGNAVPKTATTGGVTYTMDNPGFTISTPSSLTYTTVGEMGGSAGISDVSRGSAGGSSQYTITRATFA